MVDYMKPPSASTRAATVARAAKMLDVCRPGWAQMIDVGTLDLYHGDHCILAQCFKPRWWQFWRVSNDGFLYGVAHLPLIQFGLFNHIGVFAYREMYQDFWVAEIATRVLGATGESVEAHEEEPVEIPQEHG
jgi:hypothetical protein